jgi:hypothetical protein
VNVCAHNCPGSIGCHELVGVLFWSTVALGLQQPPGAQSWPIEHTMPHDPQLFGSLDVLTSHPLESMPSQSAKPASHATPHVFPSHVDWPWAGVSQIMHEGPQDAVLVAVASQPFPGSRSQSA